MWQAEKLHGQDLGPYTHASIIESRRFVMVVVQPFHLRQPGSDRLHAAQAGLEKSHEGGWWYYESNETEVIGLPDFDKN